MFGIAAFGPDLLTFFANDRRGARILTEGQNAVCGNFGIAQHHQRDHAVIFRSGGVIENRRYLREVSRTQHEIDRLKRFLCEKGQCFGLHDQHLFALKFSYADMVAGNFFILRLIRSGGVDVLVKKGCLGHGFR